MIGKTVKVIIDRPLGSTHPTHTDIEYPVNYGYVPEIIAADGEEQDAYVLGINSPLTEFIGEIVAIIRRKNDVEDKWIVAPKGLRFSKEEIFQAVAFQERYFDIEIET